MFVWLLKQIYKINYIKYLSYQIWVKIALFFYFSSSLINLLNEINKAQTTSIII